MWAEACARDITVMILTFDMRPSLWITNYFLSDVLKEISSSSVRCGSVTQTESLSSDSNSNSPGASGVSGQGGTASL
jgi:hypothetical protein